MTRLSADRREIVGGGPVLGAVFFPPVDRIGLERFERDSGVAEIFVPQLIEIVAADPYVEIARPIILHALVDDFAAGRKILDAVGTAAERRLERRGADVALLAVLVGALPPELRQDEKFADDLRQFAVARTVEGECDLAIAGFLDLDDMAIIGGELRTVFLLGLKGENHVVGRDRLPSCHFASAAQPVSTRRKSRRDSAPLRRSAHIRSILRRATRRAACRRSG